MVKTKKKRQGLMEQREQPVWRSLSVLRTRDGLACITELSGQIISKSLESMDGSSLFLKASQLLLYRDSQIRI